jgi:hypothetical protein
VGSWDLGRVERSRRILTRSAAAGSVSRGGRRGNRRVNWVWVGLYRSALPRRREGEEEWSRDRAQDGGRRQRALWVRGSRSASAARRGCAGDGQRRGQRGRGRSGGVTHGRGKGGADLQRLGKRPAAAGHACAAESGEIEDSRKTMEDL